MTVRLKFLISISIHALREEGDTKPSHGCAIQCNFYPRPPRGGRLFIGSQLRPNLGHFYPRPPRGGRPKACDKLVNVVIISIHALREEGDCLGGFSFCSPVNFYPRPPRGGRPLSLFAVKRFNDFYPRPPRGGRLQDVVNLVQLFKFLSTPSARRATWYLIQFILFY